MVIIGYSGHAFVLCGILNAAGKKATAYSDKEEKKNNPYHLEYLGKESDPAAVEKIMKTDFFISIGDNAIRKKIYEHFAALQRYPVNAVHPSAIIDPAVIMGNHGIMISAGVCINPLAKIGKGAICNTGCIIEHECIVGDFCHIGPGAVLCGNVSVGDGSVVGAASVIRQGISIGKNVLIGAGAVVVKDVLDNEVVAGNPSRLLTRQKK